ncbi:Variant surface glycoprotein [Trypanosoma congolense IL3000]|uniref:Variant surface glycoprotein n=1 Tax=Trypanosoma congolense (strain IL3000) TaxID=1068625 RepID=F9W5X9_TRYCI|nr:Variant surface glycoprotein [Trypanosoma congolense IL3000]
MMKLKCLILVVMCLVVSNADENKKKDHNHDAHNALCDLMKAAVGKWGEGGAGLSDPLKKALGKTLFGKESGWETVETLKTVPKDYSTAGGLREYMCGQPSHEKAFFDNPHQVRWSGHSSPHDMVCLCTAGSHGWPVNESSQKDTLCGKYGSILKATKGKGWDSENEEKGAEHGGEQIEATWKEIVKQCLDEDGKKGENLKEALNKFINALVEKPGDPAHPTRTQLGEGTPNNYTGCTGSSTRGVCVMYYPKDKHATPWWLVLDEALKEDEQIQKQRAEEEKRKQQQEAAKKDTNKTEDLKSTTPITNQTEQNKKENITDKLRRLNPTSGTPISRPSSWLLSVVFLF